MSGPPEPIFLERQTYRRRRLQDAARVLPFLGAILMVFPAFWSDGTDTETPGTAARGLYIFGIWFLLILGAALMAPRLLRSEEEDRNERGRAAGPDAPGREDAG